MHVSHRQLSAVMPGSAAASSCWEGRDCFMHQQEAESPSPAATAQRFGSWHKGQRSGDWGMAGPYTAAVTTISTFHSGLASFACTVAREGALAPTHWSQTRFSPA